MNLKHVRQYPLDHLIILLVTSLIFVIVLFVIVLLSGVLAGRVELVSTGSALQENVQDLQNITSHLERSADELAAAGGERGASAEVLETIGDALQDANKQLVKIDATIEETVDELGVQDVILTAELPLINNTQRQDIDRLYRMLVWVVGVLSLVAAAALWIILRRPRRHQSRMQMLRNLPPPSMP